MAESQTLQEAVHASAHALHALKPQIASAVNAEGVVLLDQQQLPIVASFQEAQAQVSARDDEKKKQAARRDKGRKVSSTAQEVFPGAKPGTEANKSAFWILMEVG